MSPPPLTHTVTVTPTLARQTQHQSFGEVLHKSVGEAGSRAGALLVGALPAAPALSAAVSAVSSVMAAGSAGARRDAASAASAPVLPVSSGGASGHAVGLNLAAGGAATSGDLDGLVRTMREEANRSMFVQMELQRESREYNTLTNVLKVRHDSAKAAINNIR